MTLHLFVDKVSHCTLELQIEPGAVAYMLSCNFGVACYCSKGAVEKYAPDAVIGALGDEDVDSSEGGYTMEEVTKHNKKSDVWVVLSNIGTQVGWSL